MSDRSQAIKDVAEALKISAGLILMAFGSSEVASDRSRGCDMLVYSVSQRERVIQLERALRGLLRFCDRDSDIETVWEKAVDNARAALEGKDG